MVQEGFLLIAEGGETRDGVKIIFFERIHDHFNAFCSAFF
jgi:hypothetical protein